MAGTDVKKTERGIVLIIVVIMIAILSTIVIDFMYSTRVAYEISVNGSNELQARHIAKSGVRVIRSLLRDISPEDLPVLPGFMGQSLVSQNGKDGWSLSISSFPVGEGNIGLRVTDERSKVNLNALVDQKSSRVDFQVRTQLDELFRFLGVDTEKSTLFVASLVNWLDGAAAGGVNDQEAVGAGGDYYAGLENPYYIKNGPLDSIEEIRMIQGMDEEFFSKVRDYLTVYPEDKKINFSTASKTVIMSTIKAAGVSVNERQNDPREIKDSVVGRMADEVIMHRRTKRIVSADETKKILKKVDSVLDISSGIAGVVLKDGKSDVYTALSTGIAGGDVPVTKDIRAVIRKNLKKKNSHPELVSWIER
ncbi:MAG: type II secretion system protein GspK [Candidatus Dadabacteria bacterium]|nr:type II secretion system protein GspK [Candidatus Dadabacteria bacterium]